MKGQNDGFHDIIVNVIDGILVGTLLTALRSVPSMESYFWMIDLFGLLGFIVLVLAIPKWSVGYIVGWAFCAWVLWSAGLMHLQEIIMYIIVPAIVLGARIYLSLKG